MLNDSRFKTFDNPDHWPGHGPVRSLENPSFALIVARTSHVPSIHVYACPMTPPPKPPRSDRRPDHAAAPAPAETPGAGPPNKDWRRTKPMPAGAPGEVRAATRVPLRERAPKPLSVTSAIATARAVPARVAPPTHFAEPTLVVDPEASITSRASIRWVFDNMVVSVHGDPADGGTVALVDPRGKPLGWAVYNSSSRIRARMFSLERRVFDDAYVTRAIGSAIARRRAVFLKGESFRAVYSDADGLPGLVADLIGGVLVVQLLTAAIEARADAALAALREHLAPTATVVHRDLAVRAKEGLAVAASPEIDGDFAEALEVKQDGFSVFADLRGGQKTGLFLDQRFNRRLVAPFCRDAGVLDLFCYVGAWSFAAAAAGAVRVTGVDSSASALAMARRGAEANGMADRVSFVESDAFDFVNEALAGGSGARYDVVVCDPPAFAKTRKQTPDALKAYLSLNYRAMRLLPVGGVLATCSCSHFVTPAEFEAMLETSARNARMTFQVLHRGGQPPDHPAVLGFPESEYLKCVVLQRVE